MGEINEVTEHKNLAVAEAVSQLLAGLVFSAGAKRRVSSFQLTSMSIPNNWLIQTWEMMVSLKPGNLVFLFQLKNTKNK